MNTTTHIEPVALPDPHQSDPHQPDPHLGELRAEVDRGSTSARGRRADQVWLVRLRRGPRGVTIAVGLAHPAAERLAGQLNQLLRPGDSADPSDTVTGPRT